MYLQLTCFPVLYMEVVLSLFLRIRIMCTRIYLNIICSAIQHSRDDMCSHEVRHSSSSLFTSTLVRTIEMPDSLMQAPEQKHFIFQNNLGHMFLTREMLSTSKPLIEQCVSLSAVKDTNADIEPMQWQSKSVILLQATSL